MLVVKKTMQKRLIAGAALTAAIVLANFSYAQTVGGVIQGARAQQSQQSQFGTGNVQPVNQNAQLVLQLQALRAELASLRNQVDQQGYQLRQLQASSSNSTNSLPNNNVGQNNAGSSTIIQSSQQPASSSTFQSGEILPNQSTDNSQNPLVNVQPNQTDNVLTTNGDSVQFPLLPQDQVDQNLTNSGSQALPQLVPEQSSQVQPQIQAQPQAQTNQTLSRQDRLLEEGDKLKGVQTNLGELELYNKGIDKLSAQDYKAAASIFSAQLQNFPRGEKAGDGFFWLGETFYIQDDLDSAAKSYQTLIDLFPNHIRTPKALLKLIGVHKDRKDEVSAKIAMNTLVAKYSGSVEADSARSQYSSLL